MGNKEKITLYPHPKKYGMWLLTIGKGIERVEERTIDLTITDIQDLNNYLNSHSWYKENIKDKTFKERLEEDIKKMREMK